MIHCDDDKLAELALWLMKALKNMPDKHIRRKNQGKKVTVIKINFR